MTRPEEDAGGMTRALEDRGFRVFPEPLIRICFPDGSPPTLDGVQALLFTSANGVRAFERRSGRRDLPVYAVGDATADQARAIGFKHVDSAGGDVRALAELVRSKVTPATGTLLHVAGSLVAGDLAGNLSEVGYTVERAVLYESERAETFSTRTLELLDNGEIWGVLLFSPRTANVFVKLIRTANRNKVVHSLTALCLSGAVAEAAAVLDWKHLLTSSRPDMETLLREIDHMQGANDV